VETNLHQLFGGLCQFNFCGINLEKSPMQHLEKIKTRNFKSKGFGKQCDQVFVCLKATNEPTTNKILKIHQSLMGHLSLVHQPHHLVLKNL
jgi:hypothetical protein